MISTLRFPRGAERFNSHRLSQKVKRKNVYFLEMGKNILIKKSRERKLVFW